MTITLGKLKNSEQALIKLSNSSLPIALSYKISKALKVISKELTDLEEFRAKLVQKYGTDNGEGNLVVSQENIDKFLEELNPLLQEEINLPFNQINASDLPPDLKLTPIEITHLEYFINFEE